MCAALREDDLKRRISAESNRLALKFAQGMRSDACAAGADALFKFLYENQGLYNSNHEELSRRCETENFIRTLEDVFRNALRVRIPNPTAPVPTASFQSGQSSSSAHTTSSSGPARPFPLSSSSQPPITALGSRGGVTERSPQEASQGQQKTSAIQPRQTPPDPRVLPPELLQFRTSFRQVYHRLLCVEELLEVCDYRSATIVQTLRKELQEMRASVERPNHPPQPESLEPFKFTLRGISDRLESVEFLLQGQLNSRESTLLRGQEVDGTSSTAAPPWKWWTKSHPMTPTGEPSLPPSTSVRPPENPGRVFTPCIGTHRIRLQRRARLASFRTLTGIGIDRGARRVRSAELPLFPKECESEFHFPVAEDPGACRVVRVTLAFCDKDASAPGVQVTSSIRGGDGEEVKAPRCCRPKGAPAKVVSRCLSSLQAEFQRPTLRKEPWAASVRDVHVVENGVFVKGCCNSMDFCILVPFSYPSCKLEDLTFSCAPAKSASTHSGPRPLVAGLLFERRLHGILEEWQSRQGHTCSVSFLVQLWTSANRCPGSLRAFPCSGSAGK